MKIYQLTAVQRVSTARGYLRLVTESDRSNLITFYGSLCKLRSHLHPLKH
ncbi:hypothetical protein [Nostoc sp. TCL240-02]|nr:hypothetical protein [Nostoc sp. TCL240-02]